jgi:hypothetical protein
VGLLVAQVLNLLQSKLAVLRCRVVAQVMSGRSKVL